MNAERQFRFWLVGLIIFIALLYLLRSVLLPFVAGMAVAYFMDPLCDSLERKGLSRTLATSLVTLLFVLLSALALLLLVPALVGQLTELLAQVPALVEALRNLAIKLLESLQTRVDPEIFERLRAYVSENMGMVFGWVTDALKALISGGVAIANLVSLIFITPVVAFYLLRDWDRIMARMDSWLPLRQADDIRQLVREVDERLAGFLRGQGMVCLILGVFYAAALSLAGLKFGLLVGMLAGLLTFIPYVGSIVGLVLSVGLALFQFDDWVRVLIVAVIFFVGQALEGNFLTPKLVGERVGLHPVWVIFGLLAGGALLGFVGMLLALPVTAIIGVGVRYGLNRYLASDYYSGGLPIPVASEDSDGDGEGSGGTK